MRRCWTVGLAVLWLAGVLFVVARAETEPSSGSSSTALSSSSATTISTSSVPAPSVPAPSSLPPEPPSSWVPPPSVPTTTTEPPTDEHGVTLYPPPPSELPTTKTTASSVSTSSSSSSESSTSTTTRRTQTPFEYNPDHPEDRYTGQVPLGELYTWWETVTDDEGETHQEMRSSQEVLEEIPFSFPEEEEPLPPSDHRWLFAAGVGVVLALALIGLACLFYRGKQDQEDSYK